MSSHSDGWLEKLFQLLFWLVIAFGSSKSVISTYYTQFSLFMQTSTITKHDKVLIIPYQGIRIKLFAKVLGCSDLAKKCIGSIMEM